MTIEKMGARRYYRHPFAIGMVVIVNGGILFHGTVSEATKLYRKWTKKRK